LTYFALRLADFSAATLQARREWNDIFQVLNRNNCQPRLPYPERLSIRIKGEIKAFQVKQKLRKFKTTRLALERILKEVLHPGV
jgi:hypothetical protein